MDGKTELRKLVHILICYTFLVIKEIIYGFLVLILIARYDYITCIINMLLA